MSRTPFGMDNKGSVSIEAALLVPIIILMAFVFVTIINVAEASANLKHLATIHADYAACKEESLVDSSLINIRAKKQWIVRNTSVYTTGPIKQDDLMVVSAKCNYDAPFVGERLLLQRAYSILWPEYDTTEENVWELQPMARGYAIQEKFGRNLPRFFPVICKFNNNTAVSMLSADLTLKTYQVPNEFFSLIYEEVVRINEFKGGSFQNTHIDGSSIFEREVWIVVPDNTLNVRLKGEFDKANAAGIGKGIRIKLIEFQNKED